MFHITLDCPHCGYHAELLEGSVQPSQTLSDVNEDFAYYRLFRCPVGGEILSMDVNYRGFDGRCPEHTEPLEPLEGLPAKCPVCSNQLNIHEKMELME